MKPKIEREYGFLKLEGKYYKSKMVNGRNCFEEVSKETFEKKIKLIKEISTKLKDNLDKEAVLHEALSQLDDFYLDQLHNTLYNSKRKVKPITRKHHCVDMKVGKMVIPIIN